MTAQVISFNCVLKNRVGKVISETFNKDVINSTSNNDVLKGLAIGLQNLKKGEKRKILLDAEDAYGFYDPKKVILFPRSKIPKSQNLKIGSTVEIVSKTGTKRRYSVQQLHPDFLTLDGNHPLAGQDLIFEIETISARLATDEELQESCNLGGTQYFN